MMTKADLRKTVGSLKQTRGRKPNSKTDSANAGANEVRIRMYDVGFGDCFLLFVPTSEGEKRILIDCGSRSASKHTISQIAEQVVADVTDGDGKPRIDVVIMTHRHLDHISGFANRCWDQVEVKEVWMPWTENPEDKDATRIRNIQTRLALALDNTLNAKKISNGRVFDLVFNSSGNENAVRTLHEGFAGNPPPKRYFMPEKEGPNQSAGATLRARRFETSTLPGVSVYILGPSRDEAVLRDMEPPAGKSYLRLVDSSSGILSLPKPFDKAWWYDVNRLLNPGEEQAIKKATEEEDELLAVSLENAVNATSLMIVFKIGQAHLLFSGDAQWGTWQTAIQDPEWSKLLARIRFYKVGHHGSANATPREFVEDILKQDPEFRAMISVKPVTQWPLIPREQLIEALKGHSPMIARSDDEKPVAGFERLNDLWIETKVPIK